MTDSDDEEEIVAPLDERKGKRGKKRSMSPDAEEMVTKKMRRWLEEENSVFERIFSKCILVSFVLLCGCQVLSSSEKW